MAEDEIKKGRTKPEDWPEELYWESGTYRQKGGKPTVNPMTQCYPGQPVPPENAPDEIDPLVEMASEELEPWFSREPSWHGRDAERCREYLESLSDEELIRTYNELRDEKVVWGGGYYYPNIKKLFLTPFEREKDRREMAVWRSKYGKSEEGFRIRMYAD